MKVSVVIPCFNHGQYLEEAILSAKESTYRDIEIIVVNDGSTDPITVNIIKELEHKHTDVKFIHQRNKGLPGARNAGIRVATGTYIVPLDADDLIAPTFIEKAMWVFMRKPEISIVYCLVQLFGKENYIWHTREYDLNYLNYENFIPATAMYSKRTWSEVGGYNESFTKGYEDWEFWLNLGNHGHIGYRIDEVLFYYRKHSVSMLQGSNERRSEIIKEIRELYPFQKQKAYFIFNKARIQSKLYKIIKNAYVYIPNTVKQTLKSKYYGYISKRKLTPGVPSDIKDAISSYSYKKITNENLKNKEHILVILPWLQVGGVESVYLELTRLYAEHNMDFIIVTTKYSDHIWEELFQINTKKIYHLPKISKNVEDQITFLIDLINVYNVKVIQISNSVFGYMTTPVLKREFPSVKIINHLHMEEPNEPWDHFRVSVMYDNYIDCYAVLTTYQAERLKNHYHISNEKIVIIPNGINGDFWLKGDFHTKRGADLTIAFVGRLESQKNPILFLQFIKILLERNQIGINNVKIIGKGSLLSLVKRKIANDKVLKKYVDLMGSLSPNNLRSMLHNEIDILILPSLKEGHPMIGLEAMASGVLLVVSDVPGWNDLIENERTGVMLNQDITTSVKKIEEIVLSDNLLNEITMNAKRVFEEKYTSSKMFKSYINLYKDLKG